MDEAAGLELPQQKTEDVPANTGHHPAIHSAGTPEQKPAELASMPVQQTQSMPVRDSQSNEETGELPGYWSKRYRQLTDPSLGFKKRLRLIPGVGYVLAWVNALVRLPVTRHNTAVEISRTNDRMLRELASLQQQIRDLETLHVELRQATEKADKELRSDLAELQSLRLAARLQRYDALDIGKRLMEFDKLQIARRLKLLEPPVSDAGGQTHAGVSSIIPMPAVSGAEAQEDKNVTLYPGLPEFDSDAFYVDFEARFRGSRQDIKERLKVHLPCLAHITALEPGNRPKVIDVGCGRGEWLELLTEHGIPALGIDFNAAMVEACRERGHSAQVADAIEYLLEQPEASLGAVTGFHIIEHLPFQKMIALYDAALRALQPGGVIIFETPNPENLLVGACSFYNDPTHLRPIVPDVAAFIASQRGYSDVEILRLHPFSDAQMLKEPGEAESAINHFLFGAQDYAVIARK